MEIKRKTKETKIDLNLNIDGKGKYQINTEDTFLTHMCETLAKYGSFDMDIDAQGSGHHLIEDVGICIGKALRKSIKGREMNRIASTIVPMDDALILVSVDLIDRPYTDIELPDQMYVHFLRSFGLEAKITLHVKVLRGEDTHHQIEAGFKALGLALHQATRSVDDIKSTKGEVKWGT